MPHEICFAAFGRLRLHHSSSLHAAPGLCAGKPESRPLTWAQFSEAAKQCQSLAVLDKSKQSRRRLWCTVPAI